MKLTIPRIPVSLNKLLRMHWTTKRRDRDAWKEEIQVAMPYQYPPARKGERLRLAICQYRSRMLDRDNLYGSVKNIVDALCDMGLIFNDDDKHLDLHVSQVKAKRREQKTEITVAEYPS
jgi:Holliday junction resolvase RusA-like endonuclease